MIIAYYELSSKANWGSSVPCWLFAFACRAPRRAAEELEEAKLEEELALLSANGEFYSAFRRRRTDYIEVLEAMQAC